MRVYPLWADVRYRAMTLSIRRDRLRLFGQATELTEVFQEMGREHA